MSADGSRLYITRLGTTRQVEIELHPTRAHDLAPEVFQLVFINPAIAALTADASV